MSKFTIEQHQMLEDLTGKQYCRNGKLRTKWRTRIESDRLGLKHIDPYRDLMDNLPLTKLLRKIRI